MRNLKFFTVLICLFSAGFSAAEYLLFQENFDDGTADGFASECPIWEVTPEGTYQINNSGYEVFCWSFAGETWWDDYSYSLSLKSQGSINQIIAFRVQDNDDCYVINVRADPWNDVWLFKIVDGEQIPLLTTGLPNLGGIWHVFNVVAIGPTISFALDGQQAFTYSDTNNPYMFGKIGVVSYTGGVIQQQTLDVDNIVVEYLVVPTTRSTMSSVKALYR